MDKIAAEILKKGAEIREASYDGNRYTLSCMEACVKASPTEQANLGWILGLALDGWWDDALDWASDPHD